MIQTNWYVITGNPSSGKTKTIQNLEKLGHLVVQEVARKLINDELKQGITIEEIRRDEKEFNQKVLQMKIKNEERISENRLCFFDRGIPDSIAYSRLYSEDTTPAIKASMKRRYAGIFHLDPLKYEKDYARLEDSSTSQQLDQLIYTAYKELNYSIVPVPVMSVEERVEFILGKIDSLEK